MSKSNAIATVTATLRAISAEIARDAVPGAEISTDRPDAREGRRHTAAINLFLFRASVNSTFRNHDTPTRDSRGNLVQHPATGLDLDYLFTFSGPSVEAQLLLGQTVAALHAEPILTPRRITETIDLATAANQDAAIADADLADQAERLRVTPIPLDLEELSKLWSVFLQVPYDLSIAYRVSVVLISADVAPRAALPVRGGEALPTSLPPWIERILVRLDARQQPTHVSLQGSNLVGDLEVQFGNLDPVPARKIVSTGEVQANLPARLVAGITPVRVIRNVPLTDAGADTSGQAATRPTVTGGAPGTSAETRPLSSNEVMLVVRPEVEQVSYDRSTDTLTLTLVRVAARQRGTLLLNRLADPHDQRRPGTDDVSIDFQIPAAAAGRPLGTVSLPTLAGGAKLSPPLTAPQHNVRAGNYLVRVRVDGAESILGVDEASGRFESPMVTIP